jgi:hypothetical protein
VSNSDILAASLAAARAAKRISGTNASYRKDNPLEYAKVIAYLDGGARPSGVLTKMGEHLVLVEDVRRALAAVAATLDSRDDLGMVFNEQCMTVIAGGFKFVTTVNDPSPWDATTKGSLAQVPGVYSPPGTRETWSFDLLFPSAGNAEGFPKKWFAGTLWQWHHARNDIVSPVGSGCHLALDGRDDAGDEGMHFMSVESLGTGQTVDDFAYHSYPIPGRPPIQFDHTYRVEIDLLHSGGADGFFTGKIDGQVLVDYHGPNLPTNPGGQNPYLQFGHYSVREKTNEVHFTNIVRFR